ncbi:flagellar protein FliT [Pseudomonas helleri]|uniref:Flagellar protein FliT n=1 Tax=Pseudomonas helleri TaxID=1608996 RepID=A0A6G1WCC3_9PSED|nr:flagellar protein FliT [Pseudomonas helleri]MQT28659.1 flagellar protein FliT [Pseudomonas helleri]MQU19356.1 flagellar protein FliT [Pseudomonas helleri]
MSQLQRIQETRDALIDALAERNWEAIGELDLACRQSVESVLDEAPVDEAVLRENLEGLLVVYRMLLEAATGERQQLVDQMSQINQAKNASKVYHLFF